ncbi:MAG: lipid-A-disaccharide synthase [Cardiobacteriaceae bacterium]|nr:lipid-A-disaccharide synthase [Cardiobacteriaceae bacterium]
MTKRFDHPSPHIALVAGEASGDRLGAPLLVELKKRFPNARFSGVGGVHMQATGFESLLDMRRLSVMGLVEVLKHLPDIYRAKQTLLRYWQDNPPDIFIGIDAPDFNLRLARKFKACGVKTVHYVSPSLWAWKEKRIENIKNTIDLMLCLFPFELPIYEQHGVKVLCVGHAMQERLRPCEPQQARKELGLPEINGTWLGLFAGSRLSEQQRLTPIFLDAYQKLKPYGYQAIMQPNPALEHLSADKQQGVILLDAPSHLLMSASDVLLLKSGTITLEAAFLARPMVVAHRVNALTAWLARRLLKTKRFALPNLLLQQDIVPELMQEYCNSEDIKETLLHLDTKTQQSALKSLNHLLPPHASVQAANAISDLITSP